MSQLDLDRAIAFGVPLEKEVLAWECPTCYQLNRFDLIGNQYECQDCLQPRPLQPVTRTITLKDYYLQAKYMDYYNRKDWESKMKKPFIDPSIADKKQNSEDD